MPFGKDDKKSASEVAMSPEELARANQNSLLFLKEQFPAFTMDQAQGYANRGMAGMLAQGMPIFGGLIQSAMDNFNANPSKHATAALIDKTLGEGTSTGGASGPAVNDEYEKRIKELMDRRGLTREEAEARQAKSIAMGLDINNDGVVSNDEYGIHLGQDLDGDGVRSKEEIAQWRKDNKDHFAAGGTKYGGLPGNYQTTPLGTIQGLDERRAMEAQQAQQAQQAPAGQPVPQQQVAPPPMQGVNPAMMGGQVGVQPQPQMQQPAPQQGHPVGAYVPNRFMGTPQPRGRRGRAQ